MDTVMTMGIGVPSSRLLYSCVKTAAQKNCMNVPIPAAVPARSRDTLSAPACALGRARPWEKVSRNPGIKIVSGVTRSAMTSFLWSC